MKLNPNSLKAYRVIEPELTIREKEVFDVVDKFVNGITMKKVAEILGVGTHQISGRFGALTHEKKRLIIVGKTRIGRHSHSLYVSKRNYDPKKVYSNA